MKYLIPKLLPLLPSSPTTRRLLLELHPKLTWGRCCLSCRRCCVSCTVSPTIIFSFTLAFHLFSGHLTRLPDNSISITDLSMYILLISPCSLIKPSYLGFLYLTCHVCNPVIPVILSVIQSFPVIPNIQGNTISFLLSSFCFIDMVSVPLKKNSGVTVTLKTFSFNWYPFGQIKLLLLIFRCSISLARLMLSLSLYCFLAPQSVLHI